MLALTLETPAAFGSRKETMDGDARHADEGLLVRRIRSGEEAAFRELVERYQSRIFRVVYGILRNREDAEDLAQEVFAKVYFSIRGFDGRGSLFGWVYRIALNECYGRMRKKRVVLVFEGDARKGGPAMDLRTAADRRPGQDHTVAERDFVNKLLARIPDFDRVLLLGREVQGFSVSELAEMTGLNENTVKVRLLRVRRRLARLAACFSRPAAAGCRR
ncbi:MAG: sigma-70 family RNA polymerase sigma factor [Bryobacterales bacterium]|nr:sigma-70 family RNA polymerase sigma factor [Bryobacterales bacterium]